MDPLDRPYPQSERRKSYPELFQALGELREKMERIEKQNDGLRRDLQQHVSETEALTNAWLHSRWLVSMLKVVAVTAATLTAGWIAIKQLLGAH